MLLCSEIGRETVSQVASTFSRYIYTAAHIAATSCARSRNFCSHNFVTRVARKDACISRFSLSFRRVAVSMRDSVHGQCNPIPVQEGEGEQDGRSRPRARAIHLSILQKLPRVTGPFVNEIESPVTAVPRRRRWRRILANGEPAAYVKPERAGGGGEGAVSGLYRLRMSSPCNE